MGSSRSPTYGGCLPVQRRTPFPMIFQHSMPIASGYYASRHGSFLDTALLSRPMRALLARAAGSPHSMDISCQLASLLANILPTAAMIRKMSVSPPTRYHHWLLLIWGIHAYSKVSMIARKQEKEPTTTHAQRTGRGTMRH